MDIIKIPLKNYIHVRDTSTNVTTLIEGPKNYALQSNEVIALTVSSFIQLRNNTFVKILNPIRKNEKGEVLYESFGQAKLKWGDEEIRTSIDYKDPFPLYPGEMLKGQVTSFEMINSNEQAKLQAVRPYYDELKKKKRNPGDIWMIRGPISLVPKIEFVVLEKIKATINKNNSAIKIRALRDTIDKNNNPRKAGEVWLIREPGAYLPNADEEIVDANVASYTLTDKVALHLKAICDFTDVYAIERRAGDEWLVTNHMSDLHIIDVYESLVKKVNITILNSRQYCVILNPVVDGVINYGERVLKRGEASFFLQPGESLEGSKVKSVIVLDENNALLLKAIKEYEDEGTKYFPGDRWIVRGPREFILPLELELLEERNAIPLDENEGIYVRDVSTGHIKIVTGQTYLLAANEELWSKELDPVTEGLIYGQYSGSSIAISEVDERGNLYYNTGSKLKTAREKHRVVTFRAPQNAVVQVFDYKSLKNRIIFGPELIKLGPHEEFTIVNLSGKKPKVENQIQSLSVLLGPDFMTDIIEVETKDHARLSLQLCYSWKFAADKQDLVETEKIFKVNDFIGDACKNLAARIRGAVSTIQFEVFHKNSAAIVKSAVFGFDEKNMVKDSLKFESNNLMILNVDIHTQEPIDPKTRENLSKSTNLSIQSQNAMQQAETEHKQNKITEENKGKLDLQVLEDNTSSERQIIEFLKKKVETEVVKTTGELKAKANAIAKSNEIIGESLVSQATMNIEAKEIEELSVLTQEKENLVAELKRKEELNAVEIEKIKKTAEIEVDEFKKTIKAIGKETIVEMAKAGPETQAKLLGSLGIKSFLITDGKNPINLFNTAKGVIAKNK